MKKCRYTVLKRVRKFWEQRDDSDIAAAPCPRARRLCRTTRRHGARARGAAVSPCARRARGKHRCDGRTRAELYYGARRVPPPAWRPRRACTRPARRVLPERARDAGRARGALRARARPWSGAVARVEGADIDRFDSIDRFDRFRSREREPTHGAGFRLSAIRCWCRWRGQEAVRYVHLHKANKQVQTD